MQAKREGKKPGFIGTKKKSNPKPNCRVNEDEENTEQENKYFSHIFRLTQNLNELAMRRT